MQISRTYFVTKVAEDHVDVPKTEPLVDTNNNNIQNLTIPPPSKPSASSLVDKWIRVGEQVAKAEALWAMKCTASNYSFSLCDKTDGLFQYLYSLFYGHAFAERVSNNLVDYINKLN